MPLGHELPVLAAVLGVVCLGVAAGGSIVRIVPHRTVGAAALVLLAGVGLRLVGAGL